MLLSTVFHLSSATRILDELLQPSDAVLPPVVPPQPEDPLPAPPVDPPTDPTVVAPGPVGPVGPTTTAAAAAISPATGGVGATAGATTGATTGAATGAIGAEPITFFMHDIVGGTKPSVRIVTGVVASTAASGQLPFARPNTDIFPIQGALPLPENANNLFNNNNVPYVAGLSGTSTTIVQNNANSNGFGAASAPSGDIPFVNAADLPTGTTLENLLFGTTTVIDDELTEGHEIGSAVLGRAQGFYVASSQDGTSKTVLLTALFEGGDHTDDTISFFGVHRTAAPESHIAVIGGTGKYDNARGFAVIQTLHPGDQGTTDGVETLLQFSVHLS